ncbi:hypothetical protein AgCh_028448 [Apium graveolens]
MASSGLAGTLSPSIGNVSHLKMINDHVSAVENDARVSFTRKGVDRYWSEMAAMTNNDENLHEEVRLELEQELELLRDKVILNHFQV